MKKRSKRYKKIYELINTNQNSIEEAINLVKILTVESQENFEIYNLISILFKILNDPLWLKNYIFCLQS